MEIVSGYTRKCKGRIAGLKSIWLLKYVKYGRSEIITDGNLLISFPETFVFKFDSLQNPSANETMQQNEGGKFYEQTISLTFSSAEVAEIELMQQLDFRILALDNNGLYRIYGLWNGMQGGNITYTTGGGKSELNGFKIDFNGLEENESLFVENPFEIGFINEGFDYYLDFLMYG